MSTVHVQMSKPVALDLVELPRDLRRMLRVQWKEFIHYLEDYEIERCSETPNFERSTDRFRSAA